LFPRLALGEQLVDLCLPDASLGAVWLYATGIHFWTARLESSVRIARDYAISAASALHHEIADPGFSLGQSQREPDPQSLRLG
jgi:hypothetical protein